MFEVNYSETRQSVSLYNGSESPYLGLYYKSTINYEDGKWHTWKFEYFPDQCAAYIDGVLQWKTTSDQVKWIPKPGMEFLIGGYSTGKGLTDFTFTIDTIKFTPYTAPPSNPCQTYIDQITALNTQITALNTQITALNTQITALKAKITKALADLSD